jgi:hypothetical protein
MTQYFAGLTRSQILEMTRHECGHILVARALGFNSSDLTMSHEQFGAGIDLYPSLSTTAEAIDFLRRRLQILHAGVQAQSLSPGGLVRYIDCERYLNSNAKDDFSKIRELTRVLVGLTHPNSSPQEFADELLETGEFLFRAAKAIIEANALVVVALQKYIQNALADHLTNGGRKDKFVADTAAIDAFFNTHPLTIPDQP